MGEREEISRCLVMDLSLRQIARQLGRQPSTISREVGRFEEGREGYRAFGAHRKALGREQRRRKDKCKLLLDRELLEVVLSKLKQQWSPEQIAQYLKRTYESRVCAETIYNYMYVFLRRELRKEWSRELRRAHKKRRKRGRSAKGQTSNLKNMTLIDKRPVEVMDRLVPGHWEGDLIIGGAKAQSALGTLVERKTRFAILVPLKNKTALEVRKRFALKIKKLPQELRLSLTYDQGREMAQHERLSQETNIKVYFTHPQSPWERGTNENTNGLIRQYFPKGIDFTKVSWQEISKVQRLLNTRPRKTLDWKTPQEAFQELLR